MTSAWLRALGCVALLALGGWAVHGCSLNPQPLPPGDTADGSAANPAYGDGGTSTFGGSDSGKNGA
ncbi:MAG: hypothetical protein ACRELB_01760, partial [Polyangiaceae bacterium]